MFHHRSPHAVLWACASAVALSLPLALGAVPASATPLPPAPGTPAGPGPAAEAPAAPGGPGALQADVEGAAEAVPAAKDPEGAVEAADAIRDVLAETPEPGKAERKELASNVTEAVGTPPDASMGQGMRRIEETGDPLVPTVEELEGLAEAAEASAEAAQVQAAPKAAPAAFTATTGTTPGETIPGAAEPASFAAAGVPAAVPMADPQEPLRTWRPPGVLGVDVAHHQGDVDWDHAWSKGVRFAYIKATQSWPSTVFKDPQFSRNYSLTYQRGIIRGAYHFAMPAHSSGATQAREFVQNGGGWSADGKTLPPLLDIEWNPYDATTYPEGKGNMCYGMTPSQMVTWIKDFGNTVKSLTGRLPMIYTAQSWWDVCTGDSTAFKGWPLHVALYPTATSVPKNPRELPEGWRTFNVWQYSSYTDLIGGYKSNGDVMTVDGNVWNGDLNSLRAFALNKGTSPRLTTEYLGNGDVVPTRLAPVRVYGTTKYDTPVEISRRTFPTTASTVVVASGENFPDALSGSPLATLKGGPLLLTAKNSVPASLAEELVRLKPKTILVLGGPLAVSDATVSKLRQYGTVQRVYGQTLYDTSSAIANQFTSAPTVFLATGERFEDAMSLAAVAAARKAPMLLTKTASVPTATLNQLKRLNPSTVSLAGGTGAISAAAEQQVRNALPNARIVRHGGTTLYDTSAAIATAYWPKGSQRQFVATGANFPDGLTGAVAAAYNGAPLLLAQKECIPQSIATAMGRMQGWTNVLLGGPLVLDADAVYRYDGKPNVC